MAINKEITFGEGALTRIQKGINTVAELAGVTLGPRGRNIIVDRGIMPPSISNDGLDGIRTVILKDRLQNMGADIVRDVAIKTNDKARGARTASIVLTQSIFNEGFSQIKKGVNVIAIKKGIEKGAAYVIEELKKRATKIETNDQLKAVATISSESEECGAIVAEAFDKVGKDGIVKAEESTLSSGITLEIVDGMKIERGWINPWMVNNPNKMEAEYDNVAVMIVDKKMIQIKDFLPIQEKMATSGIGELLIIAEDVDGEALETLVGNNMRGGFRVVAIKSPGFGVEKKEILKDIEILTGAKIISDETGNPMKTAELDSVGFAKKIVVSRNETVIIGNPNTKELVNNRIEELKTQLSELKSNIDIKNMESRIGKLSGGAGIIKIGALTEAGMKYLKMKIDDSIDEARNSLQEGFVKGGGSELFSIADSMSLESKEMTAEEKIGFNIVMESIKMPLKKIMINAGENDIEAMEKELSLRLKEHKDSGYDAISGKIVDDMIEAGIIDSIKVIIIALQNAAEAAATALTIGASVSDEIKDKEEDKNNY